MKKILAIGSNHFYMEGGFVYAVNLAKALKAELHPLYVIDTDHGYLIDTTISTSELGREAKEELKRLELKTLKREGKERLAKIEELCKANGVKYSSKIVKGNTKNVLFREARNYDLAVMGFRRVGKLKELLVGTETDKIVEKCPSPLLIVKDTKPIKKVLTVGTNNLYPKRAIRYAIKLADSNRAKLSGLYVIDTTIPYVAVSAISKEKLGEHPNKEMKKIVLEKLEREGKEKLDKLKEICGRKGIELKAIIKKGDPMKIAIETAKREGSDILVMGYKKIKKSRRFILKSELEDMIERAPHSILIVK